MTKPIEKLSGRDYYPQSEIVARMNEVIDRVNEQQAMIEQLPDFPFLQSVARSEKK